MGHGSRGSLQWSTVNVDAVAFSEQWVGAWNAHDVELVLEHFDKDVVFTSPVAAKLMPDTAGIVHGKPALRDYWTYRHCSRFPTSGSSSRTSTRESTRSPSCTATKRMRGSAKFYGSTGMW